MGIKTEDFCSNIPPKEMTEGIDWLKILDDFDPSKLEQRYLNECARRNPFDTCYGSDAPSSPVGERLRGIEKFAKWDREELGKCVDRIEREGLSPLTYKQARQALIQAIGKKGAEEYVRREYESLGTAGRKEQEVLYKLWHESWVESRDQSEAEYDDYTASVHEKIVRIRKGLKGSDGKPLTQRDFAKLIEYPINKYAEAEKIPRYRDEPVSEVEEELLEKLVMIAHANPYWLFDPECESHYAEADMESPTVKYGDAPCVYATVDIILKWIKEGKPRDTYWEDGVSERD